MEVLEHACGGAPDEAPLPGHGVKMPRARFGRTGITPPIVFIMVVLGMSILFILRVVVSIGIMVITIILCVLSLLLLIRIIIVIRITFPSSIELIATKT